MGNNGASGGFRWTLRILGWSVALVLMFPLYRMGTAFKTIEFVQDCSGDASYKGMSHDNLFTAQRFSLCMFLKSNYMESHRLEPALRDVMALPNAPCERVGVWKSARRKSVYRITLKDDGTFFGEQVTDFAPSQFSGDASGYWGEHDGKMVWIYNNGVIWPPDINRIDSQSADTFTLIEVNGEHTVFTKERDEPSTRCTGS